MRTAVLVIAGLELLLLLVGWIKLAVNGLGSDLAGNGMTQVYVVVASILALALLVPSLLLGWHGKVLWLALGLSLLASVAVLMVLVAE